MLQAVSHDGRALQHAAEEMRTDEKMMETALAKSYSTVGLKVMLLSGRSTYQIFSVHDKMDDVKRELASLLNLDCGKVLESSTLLLGAKTITNLKELNIGELHEITLVLS